MIDTANNFLVGMRGAGEIVIMNPPRGPISPDEALVLAATLVAIAAPFAKNRVPEVMEAVETA
jgi:hypothetical protein